ncbi:MAG: HD domain-containing protein [Desulfobacteraceae bacterium]|nr:HD domain-containing protein [Desulfobacteraceae bacterium]
MAPTASEHRNPPACDREDVPAVAGDPGAQGPEGGCEACREPADELSAVVRRFAEGHLRGTRGSHAWDHTLRVCRLGARIARLEGADLLVVTAAAYLHDIGRGRQDASCGRLCHALLGAELAAPLVARLPLSAVRRTNILHSIRAHRFRGDCRPRTLEARVLFDADKLDAIGAVGIARAYLFAGEIGARLHNGAADIARTRAYSREDTGYREYRLKLCRIRERMLTAAGRQLAEERHRFMEAFFDRFLLEYEGRG